MVYYTQLQVSPPIPAGGMSRFVSTGAQHGAAWHFLKQ